MTFSRLDGPAGAPVLVLSNSLGTTLALWDPQMPALKEHFSVLRYDHPGHGLGSPQPVSSVAELGRDVLEILDGHGIERVSFCGLSLGGAVGTWLAINAPERIDRLVLACSSSRFGTPENWRARIEAVRAGGVEAVADAVLAIWFTPATHRDSPELVRAYREMMVSAEREGYAGCCEALATWDPGDALAGIRAPTLVIAGSEDTATPPAHGEQLQQRIPGARMTVMAGAGHLANLEQPDAFTRLLLGHLTMRSATEVA